MKTLRSWLPMLFLPLFSCGISGRVIESVDRHNVKLCHKNVQRLAVAIEIYSADFGGRYPTSLNKLIPKYIKGIPFCPAANRDTYSPSYSYHDDPDQCTVFCAGSHHPGLPADRPVYDSFKTEVRDR